MGVNTHLNGKGCWVFDRGADYTILKDFFVSESDQCIIRIKRNTKLFYKEQDIKESQLVQWLKFETSQKVTKIKKNRTVIGTYNLAAVRVYVGQKANNTQNGWSDLGILHMGGGL